MVDLSGIDRAPSLADRVKAIILTPREEWPKIALETSPQNEILRSYVLPLAAISPVASIVGSYQSSFVWALSNAVLAYAMAIVGVFVLAFVANFLAPRFDGVSNRANAFKLVAYSYTAAWLAGIFGLIPALFIFSFLGLYSLYLIYSGATTLMKVPQENAVGYTVVPILCAILLVIVTPRITAMITGLWAASPGYLASTDVGGKVTVPGGGSIDRDKVQQAAKQMEAAANGKSPPVAPDGMKALLPETIGRYARSATGVVTAGPLGSTAEGTYSAGEKSFKLRISDISALGAPAGLGTAMGGEQNKTNANSYEKMTSVNGQMQTEAWDKTTNSGKYAITVNNRFLVEAEGQAGSIDELKQAVGAIDPDDLQDLVG
jgi:hypothetical protein